MPIQNSLSAVKSRSAVLISRSAVYDLTMGGVNTEVVIRGVDLEISRSAVYDLAMGGVNTEVGICGVELTVGGVRPPWLLLYNHTWTKGYAPEIFSCALETHSNRLLVYFCIPFKDLA